VSVSIFGHSSRLMRVSAVRPKLVLQLKVSIIVEPCVM
jgi:hypothetical protein